MLDKRDRSGAIELLDARVRAQLTEETKRREEKLAAAAKLTAGGVLTRQLSAQIAHRFGLD